MSIVSHTKATHIISSHIFYSYTTRQIQQGKIRTRIHPAASIINRRYEFPFPNMNSDLGDLNSFWKCVRFPRSGKCVSRDQANFRQDKGTWQGGASDMIEHVPWLGNQSYLHINELRIQNMNQALGDLNSFWNC